MLFALIGETHTGIGDFIEELGNYAYFRVYMDEECYPDKTAKRQAESMFIADSKYTESDDLYAYVITEPKYLGAIPEGTTSFLFTRDLEGILDDWRIAFNGSLPFYYRRKYTKDHGCFDGVPNALHFEFGKEKPKAQALKALKYLCDNTKSQYKWLREKPLK